MPAPEVPAASPLRTLPGAHSSCALLTLLTILLAWPDPPQWLAAIVRPCYFALLAWFFWRTSSDAPELAGLPMRLVRGGFLILFCSFATAGAIQLFELEASHPIYGYLRLTCEHGALFLLGTTLTSYGLMLWIPQVIRGHHLLAEHSRRQSGALQDSESARSELEQRLVEADRRGMLGELAATIAHDLRNPLTIVKGTAESLCRRPRTTQEVAEHTEVIRRNIEKADHTIESLIGLARPRKGAMERIAARELLVEVQQLLHLEARRRRVTLTVAEPAPTTILATDRTLCIQALLNLVLNAVQATSAGGSVQLVARAVRRGVAMVAFAVEDRGSGLAPAVRDRVFTPFFTTKATGTGLGLASCRRIAAELGGALRLYPRSSGGARALLLLPLTAHSDSRARAKVADATVACAATDC